MRRTRIKICGMTRAEDARAAVDSGADAVGVVFAASPRRVSLEQAAEVLAEVPVPVARVGVFVDAPEEYVADAVMRCGLTAVQFCGSESPQRCSAAPVPVVKTLAVHESFDWGEAERYRGHVSAVLLDTFVSGRSGGTARVFDWDAVGQPPDWLDVYVAGGLSAENVAECIRTLSPFAVDVASGVEVAPGLKDAEKIEAFCAAVRAADEEVRKR